MPRGGSSSSGCRLLLSGAGCRIGLRGLESSASRQLGGATLVKSPRPPLPLLLPFPPRPFGLRGGGASWATRGISVPLRELPFFAIGRGSEQLRYHVRRHRGSPAVSVHSYPVRWTGQHTFFWAREGCMITHACLVPAECGGGLQGLHRVYPTKLGLHVNRHYAATPLLGCCCLQQ